MQSFLVSPRAGGRPSCARSWYRVYREQAFPVLVYAERVDREQGGELVGLLGLYLRACFVLPSEAFAPSVGLPGGAVLCDIERWGDPGTRELWLRELGHLLRSEQPLFLARSAPLERTAPATAARVARATTPLELVVAAVPRRPEDTVTARAARSA